MRFQVWPSASKELNVFLYFYYCCCCPIWLLSCFHAAQRKAYWKFDYQWTLSWMCMCARRQVYLQSNINHLDQFRIRFGLYIYCSLTGNFRFLFVFFIFTFFALPFSTHFTHINDMYTQPVSLFNHITFNSPEKNEQHNNVVTNWLNQSIHIDRRNILYIRR